MDTHDVMSAPISSDIYSLSYACLLIPSHQSHQLNYNMANFLEKKLQEICVANNWELYFTRVHPGYFQWGLRVSPSMQVRQFMDEIRHETSKSILLTFEEYRSESRLNNFWAPGYHVVMGTRPHSKEMIEEFIRISRQRK